MRTYKAEGYTCVLDGQNFRRPTDYARHVKLEHREKKPHQQPQPTEPVPTLVVNITPQEWVEWNSQLLETIRHQKEMIKVWEETVADAARTIKSLEVENRRLNDNWAKLQAAQVHNAQAEAYRDYAKGR